MFLTSVDGRLALAGILLLACVVRGVAIGSNLHVDDAYSWLVASQPNPAGFLRALAATENTPPLFYLLLSPLPIDHTVWLRLPAAVSGVLLCVPVYAVARRRLGLRVALLAALVVAVAPYLVTFSDLARAFMLGDLALLVALWAVLELAESESPAKWAVFAAASVVAVYTEYDAALFLAALTAAALWVGRPARRRMASAAVLPLLALVPWIPEMVRSQHQVGVTKLDPQFGATSFRTLRDTTVLLVLGEHGGSADPLIRWLEFGALVAAVAAVALVLRHSWTNQTPLARRTIVVIAITAVLTLAAHALAGALGVGIFTPRYLTVLVPLAAVLGAAAVVALNRRAVTAAAFAVLVAVGVAGVIRRTGTEYEPSFAPVRALASSYHPRTVLTNTPLALFYLRPLRPRFDRPSNLGRGLATTCSRPCLIIDDSRILGGRPRLASGVRTVVGPFVLTLER